MDTSVLTVFEQPMTEPAHDKRTCAHNEDSDQSGHLPSLASAQSDDQSLHCALWVPKDPRFLLADGKQSDQTGQIDAQADLSLCWAHTSFCWLCHMLAYL